MRHILLVDDEPEVLDGLLLILGGLPDAAFHTASFASEALRTMDAFPISLVIADIHMPGMNGIEMWEAIRKRNARCKVIFLSGVRDFDNIYRVIQSPSARFLTKMEPAERILAVANEVLGELEQQDDQQTQAQYHALLDCLTAAGTQQQRAAERLLAAGGPIIFENGVAFACFSLRHAWAFTPQQQQDSLARLASLVPNRSSGKPTHFLRTGGDASVLVMQLTTAEEAAALPELLQSICARAGQEAGQFLCLYSTDICTPGELLAACQSAMMLSRQLYAAQDAPMPLADAQQLRTPSQREAFTRIDFQLQMAQSLLALGQKDGFLQLVNALMEGCLTPVLNTGCAMHVYFSVLTMLLSRLTATEHAGLADQLRGERFLAPKSAQEWEQAHQRLLSGCTLAFDALFPVDPYAQQEIIAGIQQYIQDHLDRDLSLNALSARFNLNPNYLSRYFKENTNRNLHDYIAELRLGTAQRLLRTSNARVNEIARQVGYDTTHTFIRAFRRRFGVTPAEYRGKKGPDG